MVVSGALSGCGIGALVARYAWMKVRFKDFLPPVHYLHVS